MNSGRFVAISEPDLSWPIKSAANLKVWLREAQSLAAASCDGRHCLGAARAAQPGKPSRVGRPAGRSELADFACELREKAQLRAGCVARRRPPLARPREPLAWRDFRHRQRVNELGEEPHRFLRAGAPKTPSCRLAEPSRAEFAQIAQLGDAKPAQQLRPLAQPAGRLRSFRRKLGRYSLRRRATVGA